MRDLYSDSDDYESVAGGNRRLIPDALRKLSGAAVFLALILALALWSFRLGTRDATEVPVIKAMAGPTRVEPDDPGGVKAAHQGLEVNTVLAGKTAPMPREMPPAAPEPTVLVAEDAPQGELVLAAPAAMAAKVLDEEMLDDGDLPMPPQEDTTILPADVDVDAPIEVAALTDAAAGPRPRNRPSNLVVSRPKPVAAAAKPADSRPAEPKAATPKAAKAPEPAKATQVASAAPAREVSGVRSGTRLVQLGAFDSEEITRKAWSQLVARNPDLLSSKSLYVERTTGNARVFYRLRVAGFTSSEQTRQMCEALRARGVACIPVTLQ